MTDLAKVKAARLSLEGAAKLAIDAHKKMLEIETAGTDVTAPVVSGVTITPGKTSVRIQFTTDEPAVSKVTLGGGT